MKEQLRIFFFLFIILMGNLFHQFAREEVVSYQKSSNMVQTTEINETTKAVEEKTENQESYHEQSYHEQSNNKQSNNKQSTYEVERPVSLKGITYGYYVKLSFKKSSNATKYEIYRSISGEKGTFKKIGTTSKDTFLDKTAKPSKTYYYKVRGIRKIGTQVWKSDFCKTREIQSSRLDPSKPIIALTFDDGPSANTTTILKALKKIDGRATFFVVGNRVNTYKKQLKAAYDMGCEIGNHSYSHPDLGRSSRSKIKDELDRTDSRVKAIIGVKPTLIRPPYGSVGRNLQELAGRPLILWNVDTLDWQSRNADKVYEHAMSHAKDGNIILMHDLYLSTANAAKRIICDLDKKGFQMVTVSELAICKKQTMKSGKKYFNFP